jgi:hypothetical protein
VGHSLEGGNGKTRRQDTLEKTKKEDRTNQTREGKTRELQIKTKARTLRQDSDLKIRLDIR